MLSFLTQNIMSLTLQNHNPYHVVPTIHTGEVILSFSDYITNYNSEALIN